MSDQWFYRVFGEEFGPMPLEKLKDLAASGTIQALDDVRSNAGSWVPAVTIDELGLSTSERRSLTAVATPSSDFDVVVPAATDEWYYQIGGKELGPVGFDQLLEFATQEQLGADDQVKLGAGGKWRRVGSIGRLVAALPYAAVEQTIAPTARKPASRSADVIRSVGQSPSRAASPSQAVTSVPAAAPVQAGPSVEATYRVAYEQAAVKVAESIIIQAEAAFKAAEEQALSMVAWATQPGVDRYWWGWCNAVEFGPVEFSQVMGLAKSGQLKPSDFVRNGQFGQFIPTSSLPGLLNAVATLAHAAEARELATSQARAAAASLAVPSNVVPTSLMNAERTAVAATVTATAPSATPATSNPSIQAAPTSTPTAPKSSPVVNTVANTAPTRTSSDPQVAARVPPSEPDRSSRPNVDAEPARPTVNSGYSSGGFASSSSSMSTYSTYGTNRPANPRKPVLRRSTVSESTWFSDLLESLKEPKAIGSICVLALVLLIVGWGYLPKSRADDLKRYQALKGLVDEIQKKRATAPGELMALQEKIKKAAKEIAIELKDKASTADPVKQNLLFAARDEVPRLLTAGLGMESQAEKSLVTKLKEVAYELGLEKRPPVDPAMLAANTERD